MSLGSWHPRGRPGEPAREGSARAGGLSFSLQIHDSNSPRVIRSQRWQGLAPLGVGSDRITSWKTTRLTTGIVLPCRHAKLLYEARVPPAEL